MSAAALETRDLCKSFGALRVADRISLAFAPGRLHGLIGPNGAGKTTLVNLLSGALKPDSGTVALDGRDVTKLSLAGRSRAGLARTFQTAAILPDFTVEENVAFAAQARAGSSFRFFGRVGAETGLRIKARATLERVGLAGRATLLAGALSHGERRVLEIASALALQPRALLLDEPFAGLGEEDTQAGIRLIASLKGDLTLVLIEHDVAAVFALADDVSVLAQGRVLASGTPQQVRENAEVRAAYFGEEEAA